MRRRLAGWGFEGVTVPPPAAILAWLTERLGPGTPCAVVPPRLDAQPKPRKLPRLPGSVSTEALDRLANARGQGLPDLLWLRSGGAPALPDAVIRAEESEIAGVLAACARTNVRVIPRGGGTSVTGGVNVLADERPAVVLDLSPLSGLHALDGESGLATFGAGTLGPRVEAELGAFGFTLGHLPQSWELSSIGGWVVTRSAGQESLGYGRIDDLVAGVELVAPGVDDGGPRKLSLPAQPASAAGPDLRRLVLGSEGRLGVVTRVTVRVREAPARREVVAWLLPEWDAGLTAAREIVQDGVPLSMLRLSDAVETATALLVGLGHGGAGAAAIRRYLSWRGVAEGCLLLVGAAGSERECHRALAAATPHLRPHRGVSLGRGAGRRWLTDRFRHPYLRDGLLDAGFGTETLETAVPWSQVAPLRRRVVEALASSLADEDEQVVVLCHLSHPYLDGASLYFTCFFRVPSDPAAAVARWATLKRAANAALVALVSKMGATISHHHGVGSWHAPWLAQEIGEDGLRTLAAAAATFDPNGILNPHVLLDPVDRLES
ncbi:MAG TPA: FAD-binding oxidoreductase [Thermoanaerobaculia bacterium]|jgi:alkyldihydroxyacetonephosphate synthase|nr:FAD-binding oxidoreductase [Thermoanaerobaculia bacterium]